jgi:hypothetical protein
MRIRLNPSKWSYVYTETFYDAMASILKVKSSDIELLNDAGNEYTFGTKLHFQIRLKSKDFKGVLLLHSAAERIVSIVQGTNCKFLFFKVYLLKIKKDPTLDVYLFLP